MGHITHKNSNTIWINPFQSNFSATHILPQLLFILGGKEVGGLLVIILQF
jgi:hypothetical protein